MPAEVICAIISACSAVLSAVIAAFSARYVSKKEIRKMQMQWAHDTQAARNRAYADMFSAVSEYVQSGWTKHQRNALSKIAVVQTCETGRTFDILRELYCSVSAGDTESAKAHLLAVAQLR